MELSKKELSYLLNSDFLLTKNLIIQKIESLLGETELELQQQLKSSTFRFPPNTLTKGGKISKGENYKGLPYLVLDYPRKFKTKEIFAYRVMFWWGHHFSTTLHLGHMDLMKYRETFVDQLEKLHNQNIFFCVNDSPWEHHFQKDNYVLIDRLGRQEISDFLVDHQFLKLSKKLDLDKWKLLPHFAVENLILFLKCLDKID
ncbi:MAG: hypothetical protein O6939_13270 [Bacteroidetes bacterium]|nr:hypothetical protein [Bacteroidota bacterium]